MNINLSKYSYSLYDPLTGLYTFQYLPYIKLNHKEFFKSEKAAAVMLDIENFKMINKLYGYETGDITLIEISKRLLSIPGDITVIRYYSDKFILIINNSNIIGSIGTFVNKLKSEIEKEIIIEKYKINIKVIYGISYYPKDADNIETLIIKTEDALKKAKEN